MPKSRARRRLPRGGARPAVDGGDDDDDNDDGGGVIKDCNYDDSSGGGDNRVRVDAVDDDGRDHGLSGAGAGEAVRRASAWRARRATNAALDLSELGFGSVPRLALEVTLETRTKLRWLVLAHNPNLRSLPEDLANTAPNLWHLDVHDCVSLTALPTVLPPRLRSLDASFCGLQGALPRLPPTLLRLHVTANALTALVPASDGDDTTAVSSALPRLGASCCSRDDQDPGNVDATAPRLLPPRLRELHASSNQLTTLPAWLPPTLTRLVVGYNPVAVLPSLARLHALRELSAPGCALTSLPSRLPPALRVLDVGGNAHLTALPSALPSRLSALLVGGTALVALPDPLPDSLRDLHACGAKLTRLPHTLPPQLRALGIADNSLTALPAVLPPSLGMLRAGGNALTWLPELPPRVTGMRRCLDPNPWPPCAAAAITCMAKAPAAALNAALSAARTHDRVAMFRDTLLEVAWAPERVVARLNAGERVEDM